MQRLRVFVEGIVQGVGFRPFIYQLAHRLKLTGSVCNDTRGVTIEVEGESDRLQLFVAAISSEKPPLAVIHRLDVQDVQVLGETTFVINKSVVDQSRSAQIAPDTYVCDDCLKELFDPADRRYRYPFINCTNCGPRYTIVTGIPYDRPLTTMADFPMCADCLTEYENPQSRRFHAQPNACQTCGPTLQLFDAKGQPLIVGDPLAETVRALKAGKIVAVKGLGGYHLAVDATNQKAVQELRRRKQRDEKPFALMARNIELIRNFSEVNDDESRLLRGVERPIVLLHKKADHSLAEEVAPHNRYFGVMLPYTPLHYLLLENDFKALVMTSANLADEPIVYQDAAACDCLTGIADLFLAHNRRIHTRTDDSIVRVMAGRALMLRRSRGFAPGGVALPKQQPAVLAVGAELKNAICLTRGDRAFLSQHIGDLKNLEVYDSFKQTIHHLQSTLEVRPELVAHDLHPDYYSTRYALEESGLPTVAVQHHHAHFASCLAEHGVEEPAIGIIFDGIGYGADGNLWGGEFLVGDLIGYERVGHFRYQPMPGGDLATKQPWRMALSYLHSLYGEIPEGLKAFEGIAANELNLVAQATAKGLNAPLTSSCGRLFDAVAALLGIRQVVSYEGQAALELEMVADPGQCEPYSVVFEQDDAQIIFNPLPMLRELIRDHQGSMMTSVIAGRFHATLAAMIVEVCRRVRQRTDLNTVVLSGGVFQNCLLTKLSLDLLSAADFKVLTHSLVPPNDGGLALGQAVVAARQLYSD